MIQDKMCNDVKDDDVVDSWEDIQVCDPKMHQQKLIPFKKFGPKSEYVFNTVCFLFK
jgi:hypothetical protein